MIPRPKTPERPTRDSGGESSPPSSRIEQSEGRRQSAEEALRKSREDLARIQKLDALGRLAGGVTHDINNLLAVILGQSELIQKRLPPNHPIAAQVGAIQWASERASLVIRQFLGATRDPVPEASIADLAAVIASMQTMLRAALGERITLDVRCGDALGKIPIDPGRIEQILLNLIVNARDAMPEGGHLSVVAQHDITLRSGHSEWVVLEVTDSGVGMEASALERIFEPFFTTKEVGRGTGLGLWMVRELVLGCGGEISVRSTLGVGTTFEIRFPRLGR